jgi:hypothetical protein
MYPTLHESARFSRGMTLNINSQPKNSRYKQLATPLDFQLPNKFDIVSLLMFIIILPVVKIGMNRPSKSISKAKKVAPPAVPDSFHQHHRHSSGSSTASIMSVENLSPSSTSSSDTTDGGFLSPQKSTIIREENSSSVNKGATIKITGLQSGSNIVTPRISRTSMEPLSPLNSTIGTGAATASFTFHRGEPLTHKAAVYYHQQLALQEDQGIDLTQSPGRGISFHYLFMYY